MGASHFYKINLVVHQEYTVYRLLHKLKYKREKGKKWLMGGNEWKMDTGFVE